MVLIKYFGKESRQSWVREVDVAKRMSRGGQSHLYILNYLWHSKGKNTATIFCDLCSFSFLAFPCPF